jgi:hypothetical protein
VFRPRFATEGGAVFISGYVEETGTSFLANPWRDLNDPGDRASLQPDDNVMGVPLVIGAKKGIPNLNEISVQSVFQITRKLQLTRPYPSAPRSLWHTNQMFILGISNVVGLEAWNSYRDAYPRECLLMANDTATMVLTNDFGLQMTQAVGVSGSLLLSGGSWAGVGYASQPNPASFQIPLLTNCIVLPDLVYRMNPPEFDSLPNIFETSVGFPIPQWGFTALHHWRFWIVDIDSGRVLDFVSVDGPDDVRNLVVEIADPDFAVGFDGLWSTNRLGGPSVANIPQGNANQIMVCLNPANDTLDWTIYGPNMPNGAAKQAALTAFRNFYFGPPDTYLTIQVPFVCSRKTSHYLSWQANDPMVHSLAGDLAGMNNFGTVTRVPFNIPVPALSNLGWVNSRYSPWGGTPYGGQSGDPGPFDPSLKDPLVGRSDDWTFPENEPVSAAMLGRVHRGTPWQTFYLKSGAVDPAAWSAWTGVADPRESARTRPTNDWHLATLLVSWVNTNDPHRLLSVNETNPDAWSAVLDGMTVLTNVLDLPSRYVPPQFDALTISSNSLQAGTIAAGVQVARANQASQRFRTLGEVLTTPELSLASPWLNLAYLQQNWGISDEAYEKIPSQLLPMLRSDSAGSVVQTGGTILVAFTGVDGYAYAIEASSNLIDWTRVSTNYSTNGSFTLPQAALPGSCRFYRSALLP